MTHIFYLASLMGALAGLAVLDRRYRLVLWADAPPRFQRLARVLLAGLAYFSLWDLAGITLHVFFPGGSPYVTGLWFFPAYPIEEAVFLVLLCYQSLLLWRACK
jgi:lycopene cyclase domain-containing protein